MSYLEEDLNAAEALIEMLRTRSRQDQQRIGELEGLLRQAEWGFMNRCPWCGGMKPFHGDYCQLDIALCKGGEDENADMEE